MMTATPHTQPVLTVRDLAVEYQTRAGRVHAVRGISFDLYPNESLALIGESGCGKSTLGLALLRLLPKSAETSGTIHYRFRDGQTANILALDDDATRAYRWKECAMVFQGALNALNPVLRIAEQFWDTARAHARLSKAEVYDRAEHLLRLVQLEPGRVLRAYPHELSGGMRQRVMIALSLLLDPQVIIYDEPTTALDILTQRAIIDMLRQLRDQLGFAMIFISHDLALAAELADRVATMYAGKIVELGDVREIFYRSRHPYTVGLLKAVPPITGDLYEIAAIPGSPPGLITPPSGCSFHPRCPYVQPRCSQEEPPLYHVADGHTSACHYWQRVTLERQVVEHA